MFTNAEIVFMKLLGLDADFRNPSDDDLVRIENEVSKKLETSGFDADYNITIIGKTCERILDKLP